MIRCEDIRLLMSEYVDGIDDPRTRRIVERHVQLCASCRVQIGRLVDVTQQLQRLPLLPIGVSGRVTRFRKRLEASVEPQPRRRLEHYPFYVSAALAAALITLTLLLIFYLGL